MCSEKLQFKLEFNPFDDLQKNEIYNGNKPIKEIFKHWKPKGGELLKKSGSPSTKRSLKTQNAQQWKLTILLVKNEMK